MQRIKKNWRILLFVEILFHFILRVDSACAVQMDSGIYNSMPPPAPTLSAPLTASGAVSRAIALSRNICFDGSFSGGAFSVNDTFFLEFHYNESSISTGEWIVPYENSADRNKVTGVIMVDAATGALGGANCGTKYPQTLDSLKKEYQWQANGMKYPNTGVVPMDVNNHLVEHCVKITNIDDFSDKVLIGYYPNFAQGTVETIIIEQDRCLVSQKGPLIIFALNKKYFKSKGGFEGLKIEKPQFDNIHVGGGIYDGLDKIDLDSKVENEIAVFLGYSEWIPKSNPLVKKEIDYSIIGFTKTILIHKTMEVSKYNNGRSDKIEVF